MKGKVKLKDVAERAGVAVNTASTILNRRPNSWASKETEARVFKAAKDLGYRPSKTARALQSGRYDTIGILIQDLGNPFFSTIADELEVAAEENDLGLIIENCRSSLIREKRLFGALKDLEIDGIVLCLSDIELYREELAEKFERASMPIVVLGNGVPNQPFPVDAVLSDFTQGLTEAVDALCGLGHLRFAFLSALAEGTSHGSRPQLFQELLAARGVPASAIDILRCGHSIESAWETFSAFLKHENDKRPTALVAMNDLSALGAMRAARDAGLRIPEDISIVGVDDVPLSAYFPISLSTIRQRFRKITRAASDLLLSRIDPGDTPPSESPRQSVFPTHFVQRESVGPAPKG